MNTPELTRYQDSYAQAQIRFDDQIDAPDTSGLVTSLGQDVDQTFLQLLSERGTSSRSGFTEFSFNGAELAQDHLAQSFIGRAILLHNNTNGSAHFSPAIIMPAQQGGFSLTMLRQPFNPTVGFTPGLHFNLSLPAQTGLPSFGSHSAFSGMEAGHFSASLLGARAPTIGKDLQQFGDKTAHQVIRNGVPAMMAQADMLPNASRTIHISASENQRRIPAAWHPALMTETGIAAGDFPNATQLMLGAAVSALGPSGLDRASRLVDAAIAGAK